ncbi:MAG TPA: phosphotransferase [Polyangiaceae bacterium]|nr:phosphotransferase [Polyangiaceae bacterium]
MGAAHAELPLSWIAERVGAARATPAESIQSLWSGYGEIWRVKLAGGSVESVVVKCVTPPDVQRHPRGWSSDASHQRKLRSYDVECAFYEQFAPRCTAVCRVPRCYGVQRLDDPAGWLIVLEDLDAAGYAGRRSSVSDAHVEQCLVWLAEFHATFLGAEPSRLWPIGTYWHLATRADELEVVADSRLKRLAPLLDAQLNACAFQTLVHGDAKLANFCFGARGVAAVDFQYVGGGAGIKDVAYFFSSCWDGQECERLAPRFLDRYFELLQERLRAQRPDLDARTRERVEAEWRQLYPVAWADFCRFLAGWAPEHWKLHVYSRGLLERALSEFDNV